jgi:hypothetical protein
MNDSRILHISPLYDPATHGTLLRGPSVRLPSGYRVPPILLADSIYPTLSWLIPSFKKDPGVAQLSVAKKEFNKNLSKSRIYSEIAFGRMKRIFKEVGWRSGLDIDFLPQVVHACCILYNILVHIKEIDFDSIFNEMDARTALMQRDQAHARHEPVVTEVQLKAQNCEISCLNTLFSSSPSMCHTPKLLELHSRYLLCSTYGRGNYMWNSKGGIATWPLTM